MFDTREFCPMMEAGSLVYKQVPDSGPDMDLLRE